MLKTVKKYIVLLLLIFALGTILRILHTGSNNIVFDYDQIEDQFYTQTMAVDHKLLIIGRAIYGDPKLHHGVAYYYYNLPPFLISGGNLYTSLYWNIFFNATVVLTVFLLAKTLFQKISTALIAATIAAFSFQIIKFSNWLTIDTISVFLLPIFYLGLWLYLNNNKLGLIIASISLGLSIQADITFTYLIPVLIIFWLIFRPKWPEPKILISSILLFLTTILTMILTEIRLNFIGIKTLLNFSNTLEVAKLPFPQRLSLFIEDFGENFANNLFPLYPEYGIYLAMAIILLALFFTFSKTSDHQRDAIYFVFLYLFSPALILLIGYHQAPWILIGLSPAIVLISSYVISKLPKALTILVVILLVVSNTIFIIRRPLLSYELFDAVYDSTSYLAYQLQVVDYTYQQSGGRPFAINAVTFPLYYNGMWAYLYNWYGKSRYGYVPSWLGGDQLHPYDLLPKSNKSERDFYMLISETSRIPMLFRNEGKNWLEKNGKLVEERKLEGFTVLKGSIKKDEKP